MNAPSYKTNDPRGWCGDPSRGAAMGRPSVQDAPKDAPKDAPIKLYLRWVRLDVGGYDVNGTYFGTGINGGSDLWWYADADGTVDRMLRARSRDAAKDAIRAMYPNARFFR